MKNGGYVLWLTGLPGSGKTTITRKLEGILKNRNFNVEVMDGDEVRSNLSPDLGFSKEDRETHAKRVTYVSKLLSRNGVIVIVALISPYRKFRQHVRNEIDNFIEVYMKCSVETCMKRDPKGLYKKALDGEITDLTGLQDTYEEPLKPEIVIDTEKQSVEESIQTIFTQLEELSYKTSA